MATKNLVPIDIISSCVCRDCFEIGSRLTKRNEYLIELFFQGTSIFSLYTEPNSQLQKIKAEDLVFGSPWQRRLLINEINKNAFERIGNEKKDSFLILDFTDFAKDLYKLVGKNSYILQTEPSRNNLSLFESQVEGLVSPWTLPREEINRCLDLYVSDLLQRYQGNKIILCKIFHVSDYVSNIGTIRVFKAPVDTFNRFISYCYDYFLDALSKRGIMPHVIEMPKNTIGDEGQKWGLYSLHFHSDFYEYLLSAIDIALCQYENESEILACLKEDFEKRLEVVRQLAREKKLLIEEKRRNAEIEKNLTESNVRLRTQVEIAERNERLLRGQRDTLASKIENIKLSKSYKIGRFLTFVPRKLRRGK